MERVKRNRSIASEEKSQVLVDRISFLPNEVLGFILSLLTFKEATATCALSRQWRYLWTLIPKLDLDGRSFLRKVKRSGLKLKRSSYVEWVEGVISRYRSSHLTSSHLEEFRVVFDLNMHHRECIDRWLEYALSRKVQRLELNLFNLSHGCRTNPYYIFPYERGNCPDNFKLLKNLSLHLVNVSGKDLEFFIDNCRLLEQLSVTLTWVLTSLEIVRPSPSFKCLEIRSCHKLQSVVVRDSDVVTIKFCGFRIDFQLVNVPLLTEIWVGGAVTKYMDNAFGMFSSVLPQLEMFKVCLLERKGTIRAALLPEMCNLKQLVVSLWPSYSCEDSMLPIIYLINAAPRLQRFVLEAPQGNSKYEDSRNSYRPQRELSELTPRAYSHLKEVEIVGCSFTMRHFELVEHLVERASALEKITFDPRCFEFRVHQPWVRVARSRVEDENAARGYAADQLKSYVPSRIKVKIL